MGTDASARLAILVKIVSLNYQEDAHQVGMDKTGCVPLASVLLLTIMTSFATL